MQHEAAQRSLNPSLDTIGRLTLWLVSTGSSGQEFHDDADESFQVPVSSRLPPADEQWCGDGGCETKALDAERGACATEPSPLEQVRGRSAVVMRA